MEDFAGRVAVVTGAASGIGRGLARHAARQGMNVVLADVEAPALDEAVTEVASLGAEALGVRTDVSREADVRALADAAYGRFGAVHLLCNNAGVFQAGITWQRTTADWEWVLGVNFYGILHGIRAFVPRLLEQGGDAHIVNTASMAGLISVAYSGPYVVSKFAAAALTECLAHDLRAQESLIGVSCLVPGLVDTRIADSTRNRPDEPPSEVTAPDHHFVAGVLREQTSTGGRHPDEVAAIVFDAVRAKQFWIPTTDGFDSLVRGRYEALLERAMPPTAQFD
ncbi:MAG TPA: SDR family NAD(P)-dependent oxidoreductase [Acidimicrobiia bacterium]|nr:SDR family NAD(P)-dependent oxidoreductase [Acidimicrobiia bacterium]